MKTLHSSISFVLILCTLCVCDAQTSRQEKTVETGAQQTQEYLPLLEGKRVAILTNHTAIMGETHLVDSLYALGVNLTTIFAPEHGFRGAADAGAHIENEVDLATGIPVVSLYGRLTMPTDSMMHEIDVMMYDIQDVGLRFYTYLSSLYYLMEACARNDVPLILLDRPNPNGHYVDGPILDMQYKSFVGVVPIPVVHGMTLGELAGMMNGKNWLKDSLQCNVTVIKCRNYTHASLYELPVKPSPNLPNNRSIYLYPSLCPFEGTVVSLGRGTPFPFQVYGHPDMTGYPFSFTPEPTPGAMRPLLNGQLCQGVDLRTSPPDEEVFKDGFSLKYIVDAYQNLNNGTQIGEKFFRSNGSGFDRLVGASYIRPMILDGKSAKEIESLWKDEVIQFKADRKPYLLYDDIQP
jgi:Uncharacterized protein conserved in bacteria